MAVLAIGTYTQPEPHVLGRADGVYLYHFDPATGDLSHLATIEGPSNPSFVAVNTAGDRLYAVNEIGSDELGSGRVDAFAMNLGTNSAEITMLDSQLSKGISPCYVSLDASERWLLVANYSSGTIAVLPISAEGQLTPAVDTQTWQGTGPNPDRQEAPHAHMIVTGPDNRVYAVDLGTDRVYIYDLDSESGTLRPAAQPWVTTPPGSGPRHLTFGRDGQDLYVLTELDNTVVHFRLDDNGLYQQQQVISTLPLDFDGFSSAAAIRLAPDDRTLYASNRGHDSIAIFAVDGVTGTLSAEGFVSCLGQVPRDFILTPDGRHLLVANQDSSSIAVFEVDASGRQLEAIGMPTSVATPVCLAWAKI